MRGSKLHVQGCSQGAKNGPGSTGTVDLSVPGPDFLLTIVAGEPGPGAHAGIQTLGFCSWRAKFESLQDYKHVLS